MRVEEVGFVLDWVLLGSGSNFTSVIEGGRNGAKLTM